MSEPASPVRLAAETGELSREMLLRVAAARGSQHYATLLATAAIPVDIPGLPHEVLGAALLQGPPDAETFQAIRCGAMVLSDLGNSPQRILEASKHFGVAGRVAHIARKALEADDHPEFWMTLLGELPDDLDEADFLPGVSRLTSETRMAGLGRKPVHIWLRTHHAR